MAGKIIVLPAGQLCGELVNEARESGFPDLIICLPELVDEASQFADSIGGKLYPSWFFDRLGKIPKISHLTILANLAVGIISRRRTEPLVWVIVMVEEVERFNEILRSLAPDLTEPLALALAG